MGWKSVWIAACLICLQPGCFGTPAAQSELQLIVKIQGGLLEGTHFGSNSNDAAFLGVRYAAPPIGDLRWKPPQPAPKWSGTHKADNFGSPCQQLPARWFRYIEGNEDCLYLNIWATDVRPNAARPVVVYFHGGSNTQGYSQMTLTTTTPICESMGASGGGDRDRVTVMGQSAGAVDICLLMASPMSQGLFQGAILESGECQDTLNEDIRAPIRYNFIDTTGEASGERLARDLGVPSGPDSLRALRQVPANEILNAWKNDPGLHFDAIVDGWVVPKQPAQIFAEEKQLHIPILVGSNADEATVFPHNDLKTVGDYKNHLQQDTGRYWKEEFELYPVSSDADVPTRSVRLESDEFARGAYSIAQATRKTGEKSYLYYFTYVDPGKRSRLGAHHGEELFFLSNSFPSDWEHTNEDKHLGDMLRSYWAEFVKTGDPNFDGAPRWPAFGRNSGEYFEIGAHVGLRPVSTRIRTLETSMRRIVAEQK